MENNHIHIKILYAAVFLLLVGFTTVLYLNIKGAKVAEVPSPMGRPVAGAASTTPPDLAAISVGNGGTTSNSLAGTITSLSSAQIQIKDSTQGTTDTVSINAGTKFEIGGKLKDAATIQKDLAAYNAQVTLLMKDPVTNKAALAALQVPSTQEVTSATIANFKVGDQVVMTVSTATGGTYTAKTVMKTAVQ